MKNMQSRITVDIPANFHKKFKALAASKGVSMREMIVEYIATQISVKDDAECPHSHVPNKKTQKSMKNIAEGKNLVRCKNADDLFKKLGI